MSTTKAQITNGCVRDIGNNLLTLFYKHIWPNDATNLSLEMKNCIMKFFNKLTATNYYKNRINCTTANKNTFNKTKQALNHFD